MSKIELKEQYDEYTSEYLLQLRARGDGLSDLAHSVIEEIMEERGEPVPARPQLPVEQETPNKNSDILKLIVGVVCLFFANVIGQLLKVNVLIAVVFSFIFIAYLLLDSSV